MALFTGVVGELSSMGASPVALTPTLTPTLTLALTLTLTLTRCLSRGARDLGHGGVNRGPRPGLRANAG